VNASYDIAHAVAIDNSGRIVAVGSSALAPGYDTFAIARYNP
jgi:hypothetical protein